MTSALPTESTDNPTDNPTATEVFVFPAAFAQQRLWFLHQLAPDNPFYNVAAAIRLSGNLNLAALKQTFDQIGQRHETLRTTFALIDGQVCQVIDPDKSIPFQVVDLNSIPAPQRATAAQQQAIAEAQRPFNLTTDALLRVHLFQLESTDHMLLLTLHHIIADGWSIGVLLRELGELYSAFSQGQPSPLRELSIQYADFAQWQREWLQGNVLESQFTYWRQQLADLPGLDLFTDRPRPAKQTFRGATLQLELSPSLTVALEALSQQESATLFMTLLAAFQTLLYRYTGQEDIAVGSPIANRNQQALEPLIGFFVNSLVLRTDLSGNPTFRELLTRVRQVALAAYAHQDLPFEQLVQELHPDRDLSRHPLFQVAISLQNTPITALELPGLHLHQIDLDIGTARLDLEVHFYRSSTSLQAQVNYSTDLFDRSTITRLLEHLQILLAGIATNPDQRLSDLPLLTPSEHQQILIEWNQTATPFPSEQCIHQLLGTQAEEILSVSSAISDAERFRRETKIALVYENEKLTYKELEQRSNQLAHYLQKQGIQPEDLVGLCVERSIDLVVGLLGILKAGAAYLPLDPDYPLDRLRFMLQDAQVSMVIMQRSTHAVVAAISDGAIPTVCLEGDRRLIAQESQQPPTSRVTATNLAYVIYTSGSTGQPKGVLVEHRGLCNLATAQKQIFAVTPEHRILQFASLSFDASIFEIIMALSAGATLYIPPKSARLGTALVRYLQHHAITHATLPPAVWTTLSPADLPALQVLISAGEDCPPEAIRWTPHCRFFNAYGLTETTVWSTITEVSAETDNTSKPTLGRAIANTQLYVLDPNLNPVPIGTPGELYIGGAGIARGYLNRPNLTIQKFIPNPFTHLLPYPLPPTPYPHLYKTGDRVRYLPNGTLEFLGRLDRQIKVRGYRIELGEIESLLLQHSTVQTAVVVAQRSNNQQLVSYVVPKSAPEVNKPPTTDELRHYLKQQLPSYMVPAVLIVQSSLPLTASGKVDRLALAELPIHPFKPASEPSYAAPQTPVEAALASLWAQVLQLEQVSVHANFFELGGDSLSAAILLDLINRELREQRSLADLFLAPTIAQFAQLISGVNSSRQQAWSPLVALQPNGSKLPFFCIHPIFGVVLPYYALAAQLGPDQPFYGLQPLGLDGIHPPHNRIEEMAAHYIEALRQVQPSGPYQLGGWSFGGLVAFEMAQQLSQMGQSVSLLALMDTLAPVTNNRISWVDGLRFLVTTVVRSIGPFALDYWSLITVPEPDHGANLTVEKQNRPKLSSILQSIKHMIKTLGRSRSVLELATVNHLFSQEARLRLLDELTLHRMMRVFNANSHAAQRYTPQPYAHPITLFRTATPPKHSTDPSLGWSQLTSANVEVKLVPGNHLTMLRHPQVQSLAQELRSYLIEESHIGRL